MDNSELIYEKGLQISYEVGKLSTREFIQLMELISNISNGKDVDKNIVMLAIKVLKFRVDYNCFPPKFIELSPLANIIDKSFFPNYHEYGEEIKIYKKLSN